MLTESAANNFTIDILSILYNKEFSLPNFSTTKITESELKQYVGDYSSKDIPLGLKIFIKNGGLFGQGTGQPEFPLEYVEKDQFKFDNAGLKMTFFPEKAEMQLEQGGGKFLFNRKNKMKNLRCVSEVFYLSQNFLNIPEHSPQLPILLPKFL
jgi:hypothetical protein